MSELTVGVFNDSFPPKIDGVANVALNYAKVIQELNGTSVVATPWYPDVTDDYPFDVVRYPSAYINSRLGYRAGYPFDPRVLYRLSKTNMDIIHTHCPFISTVLARTLRLESDIPVVFTYHTKFDIDIDKVVAMNPVRSASIKFLLSNINACDEVWAVSRGAGENLRSLGYTGDYRVMSNGTDFKKGKAADGDVQKLRKQYGLSADMPVFLYVGRMMWYKGIRLTLDALKAAKSQGQPFRMFFVGDGYDRAEIQAYAQECGLEKDCTFVGPVYDREILRTYYSMADLFLFPSTYDTNGIVVNEAAACYCPSLIIRGSCAAETIYHNENGILATEDPADLAHAIIYAAHHRDFVRRLGENAAESVYLPWQTAVKEAYERYGAIVDSFVPGMSLRYPAYVFFEEVQRIRDDIGSKKESLKHYYRKSRQTLRALPAKHSFRHSLRTFPYQKVLIKLGFKK